MLIPVPTRLTVVALVVPVMLTLLNVASVPVVVRLPIVTVPLALILDKNVGRLTTLVQVLVAVLY